MNGKYLLATSDPDMFHRLEHRIRAHVLICWLALLLTRVAELSCDNYLAQASRR